jgi:hypothetical protein
MVSGSGDYGYMLGNYDGSSQFMTLQPDFRSTSEHFAWYLGNGSAWGWDYTSGDIKPNTWHHVTISRTSGTLRMFLDGVRLTNIQSFSASSGSISGGNVINNTTSYNLSAFRIGEAYAGQKAYKGYVSNVRFIVGSSIRNSDSNFTVPTSTLTDVTNTKLLTATNLTIGDDISSNNNDGTAYNQARASGVNPFGAYTFFDDVSGNNNNWSPNNLTYTDVVLDGTNNFATMNHNDFAMYLSEGNLKVSNSTGSGSIIARSTMLVPPNSGKWYFEGYNTVTSSNGHYIGVWCPTGLNAAISSGYHDDANFGIISGHECVAYLSNGTIRNNSTSSTVTGLDDFNTSGDIVGVLLDMDAQTVQFYNNGTIQGSAQSLPNTTDPYGFFVAGHNSKGVIFNAGQDDSFAGLKAPNGISDESDTGVFSQSQGANGKAWNSANLPSGAINTLNDETPEDYFNTVLYSGDSTSSNGITGVGFQPDLVWIKERNGTFNHVVQDSVRGIGATSYYYLATDNTGAEASQTDGDGLLSLDTDGFTVGFNDTGAWNETGSTYAAWNWKANGSGVSNTDGSITSTVSVGATSQQNWFSIVSYTGNNTDGATVGHGLGVVPSLIITKSRSATSLTGWMTKHKDLASNYNVALNKTDAAWNPSSNGWVGDLTSDTTFSLENGTVNGNNANQSGVTYIAYCFANAEGLCKVGSYVGNGSSDGTFVYTGFRPAWVMIKRTNSTGSWVIQDSTRNPYNDLDLYLLAESSNAEATLANVADYCSNGFKLRLNATSTNASGSSYIYLALAEQPFKYANAR